MRYSEGRPPKGRAPLIGSTKSLYYSILSDTRFTLRKLIDNVEHTSHESGLQYALDTKTTCWALDKSRASMSDAIEDVMHNSSLSGAILDLT